jgi:hypothetical protein
MLLWQFYLPVKWLVTEGVVDNDPPPSERYESVIFSLTDQIFPLTWLAPFGCFTEGQRSTRLLHHSRSDFIQY